MTQTPETLSESCWSALAHLSAPISAALQNAHLAFSAHTRLPRLGSKGMVIVDRKSRRNPMLSTTEPFSTRFG